MADYGNFKYGGVSFPLATGTGRSVLQDADPALFYALEFFKSVITTHIQPRMLEEAAVCGLGSVITAAVAGTLPYDPSEHFLKSQMPMPLLAIFRQGAEATYRTVPKSEEATRWSLSYVLPTLSAGQSERLEPLLHAIDLLIQTRLEAGWDPSYTPTGGALGDQAWKLAGIERIDTVDSTYAPYQGLGELWFPAVTLTLRVKELQGAQLGAGVFAGADVDEQIQPNDGSGIVDHVVDLNTSVTIPKPGP